MYIICICIYIFYGSSPNNFFKFLFIYFWLHWVFVALLGFSLVVGGYSPVAMQGHLIKVSFLAAEHRLLGVQATAVASHGLGSCGTWTELPLGTWNLPAKGVEPVVPCTGRQILNQWTTREVLAQTILSSSLSYCTSPKRHHSHCGLSD